MITTPRRAADPAPLPRRLPIAKGEHTVRNDIEDLARATYAAYNAGPAGLRRYRRKSGHRIDQAFWKKYQQIKSGNELAVASCFGITRSG
jgi:hypothetical protein